MKILFINHNPDIFSSKKSRHFGNPANVFWDLLFKSGLISTELTCKDDKKLLEEYGFGFTYLCSRPTEWITELSKEELTEGVPILRQKIIDYKPQICCFLGLTTYKYFTGKPSIQRKTGFQTVTDAKLLDCKIFVTKSLNKLSTGCNYEEKLNQMKMLKKSIIMKY
ncbi:DNA glycosylase [Conidiobolus coronatus NRRL 28638]|uniref:DNA glycosylase n=1 Tax=Conidiobolus coronatus (strain ATCC 28846 / CBS 209.66 / NRRL 28638) TaxID=796925 RepID=A0A137P2R4_CONC2|nr:DNA glycosylase [Conidiobolus coronatus NRRL 28638]|eukprot:KXN69194.1 DNA glycosylase [Conidiobolus coronatus NRRL 28638]